LINNIWLLSFTTVRGQKRFQQLCMYKIFKHCKLLCIPCLGKTHILLSCSDKLQHFSFTFSGFAMQIFSTLVTSSNLCNQGPLFTELRLLQGTLETCWALITDMLRITIAFRTGANILKSTECRCGKFVDMLRLHGLYYIKNVGRFPRHSAINSILK